MSIFRRYGIGVDLVKLPIRSISSFGFVTAKRFRSYGGKTDSVYRGNVFIYTAFRRLGILTKNSSFFVCASADQHSCILITNYKCAMDDINTDLLISLVEVRPALWDKTLDAYKDKTLKESAWREICTILNENFPILEQKERQHFGKIVLKKWTQTRDSWMKSIKKQKDEKRSGFSAKPSRLYLYHNQMSFLKKIITDSTTTQESTEDGTSEENKGEQQIDESEKNLHKSPANHTHISGTQKKRKSDPTHELDAKMLKFSDRQIQTPRNEENHHLSFFKGLLPSMASLNEDQILEFQAGVISLLQNIFKKASQHTHHDMQHKLLTSTPMQHNYPWPNYGYYPQLPQQPQPHFQNITVDQPAASPESVISPPVSVMSATSQESEEYDFADLIQG